jgi:hypothetical protein
MREIDQIECMAMDRSPKSALRIALDTSSKSWTALVDGKPEAMFGVVVESALSSDACPWFLGTDEVYRHGRELLRWGPGFLDRLCDSRFTLRNLVSARNTRAIRLLKRWGFDIGDEAVIVRGVSFLRFERQP